MSDQSELLEIEARRCAAISAGDVETLETLLSADYVHVHMNAAVDDRKGHLLGVAQRPRTTSRGELLVRLYGDMAVITGELNNQMATPGQAPRSMRAYCHQVAVRRDGAWRFVSIQLTPLQVSP